MQHVDYYPKTDFGTTSGTATYQSDMVTAATRPQTRQQQMTSPDTDDVSTINDHDRRFRRPTTPEITDSYEHLLKAITTLPSRTQSNNLRLLKTQIATFRGTTNTFNEFEIPLRNHLRPMRNKLTKEAKLHYFRRLLREEAIEFYQSLTITTETTLNDVLTEFRKEFTEDDLQEIARYKWDQTKYDSTAETLSDFFKRLKVMAIHALEELWNSKFPAQTPAV